MAKGMLVLAGTQHGRLETVQLLRAMDAVDLNQTAQALAAIPTLVQTAMIQILVVPCPEIRGSMIIERGTVTGIETATVIKTETGTVSVIDGQIIVAMIAPD